jgi:hypothetical protein
VIRDHLLMKAFETTIVKASRGLGVITKPA